MNSLRITRRQQRFIFQFLLILMIIFAFATIPKSIVSPKHPVESNRFPLYATEPDVTSGKYRLNIYNQSMHRLYIDIGCFNGDSVDQFIYFAPNSHFFDIITFEPDPENYYLCKKRFQDEKYRKHNIIVIPRVAWIRDEDVRYRVNKGMESRIETEENSTIVSVKLPAIDFSAWLSRTLVRNNSYLRIRFSMPEAEVMVLEKLILDGLLQLAEHIDIEWSDRSKLTLRAKRIYIQSALDGLGFSISHLTRPSEVQKVVERNGTYQDVPKHYDWTKIPHWDTMTHFYQRPTVIDPPRTTRKWTSSRLR